MLAAIGALVHWPRASCASPLVLVIPLMLAGCGRTPTSPATPASPTVAPAPRAAPDQLGRIDPLEEPRDGLGRPTIHDPWFGGPASLPYNVPVSWQLLRDHALTLEGTRVALAEFERRGYVRRADKDTAYSVLGSSGVVLGFEKPGVPLDAEQPVLIVHSQAVLFPGEGWVPITVVGGVVARDTLVAGVRVPVVVSTPGDEPMLVYQRIESAGAGRGQVDADDFAGTYRLAYSMREPGGLGGIVLRTYFPATSPEAADWWYGLADALQGGAVNGFFGGGMMGALVGGLAGVPPGMLYGMLAGVTGAAAQYVTTHPYPAPPRRP